MALTPTCEKIKTLKEPVIWKVLDTGTRTYATTGHSGRLYAWDREENEVVYESSAKELTALLAWGNDLIIGSGPKGILYRLKRGAKILEVFAILPTTFIWDLVRYGNDILVATGNEGIVYKVNAQGQYELFFQSTEANVLKLGVYKNRVFAATAGQGYLYEITTPPASVLKYDADGRDISDFTFINDKLYLVTSGKKMIKEGIGKDNSYFQNALVSVSLDGEAEELFTLKNQTIPSVTDVSTNELYFGTAEKGEIYSYKLSMGTGQLLYVIKDASIVHFYKKEKAIYFSSGVDASFYRVSLAYPPSGEYISRVFDTKGRATWGRIEAQTLGGK